MVYECLVKSCGNTSRFRYEGTQISFFKVPNNLEVRKQWLQKCDHLDQDVKTHYRVCSIHFLEDDFRDTAERMRLKLSAVPSQFLESNFDHSYVRREATEIIVQQSVQCALESRIKCFKAKSTSKTHKLQKKIQILERQLLASNKKCTFWKTKYNSVRKPEIKLRLSKSKLHSETQKLLKARFTSSQIRMLCTNQSKTKWSEEDVSRALCLRAKSVGAYNLVRDTWHLPLPSLRTLRRWVAKIEFAPGILYPVMHLLKCEFEGRKEIERHCNLCFDEMAVEAAVCYDPALDKIFGPHKNILVLFARGLFAKWKQPIYFNYDFKLTQSSIDEIIRECHESGLIVSSMTCDNSTVNQGIWNQLKVDYDHPSFKNCVTNTEIFCFADPPHLIKLLRNNMLDYGLILDNGTTIDKSVYYELLSIDSNEFKLCHKLTKKHLEVQGSERQNVKMAFQTFSSTVSSAIQSIFPEKEGVAEFIKLTNDAFDVLNSRIRNDSNPLKCSYGIHLEEQQRTLDKFYEQIFKMKMVNARNQAMFPFQKGIMLCINSLKKMFSYYQSSSLGITYLNVNRINQDIAENAFGIIRSMGPFKLNPNPVDAKYRLRMLCLTWHLLREPSTGNISSGHSDENEDVAIFSAKILPLFVQLKIPECEILEKIESQLRNILPNDNLDMENWTAFNESLSATELCDFGGREYLIGFIAKKLKDDFTGLTLSGDICNRIPKSWTQNISHGGLTVPSYDFLKLTKSWESYFQIFHENISKKWKYNPAHRVIETLAKRIADDFEEIDYKIIYRFVRIRAFIRIKHLNRKLQEEKLRKRSIRKTLQFHSHSVSAH